MYEIGQTVYLAKPFAPQDVARPLTVIARSVDGVIEPPERASRMEPHRMTVRVPGKAIVGGELVDVETEREEEVLRRVPVDAPAGTCYQLDLQGAEGWFDEKFVRAEPDEPYEKVPA